MRVTNSSIYESIKYNLGNISEELNKANEIASSGKRINTLSDDPVGLTQSLSIQSNLANIEQMQRNIDYGQSWLNAGESALTNVDDASNNILMQEGGLEGLKRLIIKGKHYG